MTSAEFRIGLDTMFYGDGQPRCAPLAAGDAASVRTALRAQRLVMILADISAMNYHDKYPDMPHMVLDVGTGPVFIPANLLIEGTLRESLRPVDELFRARFGRHYRMPFLPTREEGEDFKRLWTISAGTTQ